MKQIQKRLIQQYVDGAFQQIEDQVVIEHPLTLIVNGKELMTVVCSPEHIEELAIGFLISERILKTVEDITYIRVEENGTFIHIEANRVFPFFEQMNHKRYISSCCGMSRQGFVFANDVLTAKKMTHQHISLQPEDCFKLMNALEKEAEIFQSTGGVHNAALCDPNGVVISRMDIGRHNALDKIYGYCLKNNIPVHNKIVAFSGRISSEILLKVAKIGCEIILSKSAPTEMALTLAEELGITTVGFIRGNRFNVYTHPERIVRQTT